MHGYQSRVDFGERRKDKPSCGESDIGSRRLELLQISPYPGTIMMITQSFEDLQHDFLN